MQFGNEFMQDIVLYLAALKNLYSLLIIDDHHRDDILDEKARFLLKDLLDGAAEKVLDTALEVIVSIFGLSNKHSSTEQLQPQDLLDQAKFLTRTQNTSVNVDKQTDKDLQGQPINKRVSDDEAVQSVASAQSEASIYAAELQKRKNRCRVCRRSSAKQLKFEKGKSSVEETEDVNKEITNLQHRLWHQVDAQEKVLETNSKAILADLRNVREMQERIMGFQFKPSGNGAPDHSFNRDASEIVTSGALQNFATGTENKHKDIDCISKDASDAIETIESHISALKVGSKHVSSCAKQTEPQRGGVFNFAAGSGSGSVSGIGISNLNIGKKAGLVPQGDQTQLGHFVLGRNDSTSLLVRRRARETKGLTRWRQLSRYVMNPINELKLKNQTVRNSVSLSPWNFEQSKSLCENIGKDNEIHFRGNTTSQVEKFIEGQNFGLHKAIQNVKTNLGKVDSMTRSTNGPSQTNSVQGLRIPQNSDKKGRKNSLRDELPGKTAKLILDGNKVDLKNKLRRVEKTKPLVSAAELTYAHKADRKLLAVRAGNKQIHTRSKMAVTNKGPPHRTTIRQPPLSNKHNHFLVSPVIYRERNQIEKGKGKIKKKLNPKDQQKMSLSDQQDSNGSSSSSWTTQKGSTSYNGSEEYSVTDQSQINQHSATIASSESGGDYVSSSTRGRNSGYTSYSKSESSSVPTSDQSLEDSNCSGENVGYFPSDQTSSLHSSDPSYQRFSRRYRSTDRRRPKIQTGRLKKLKDKLAIIFHHHHHHHHHNYANDSTQSDDQSQAYHGTPLSKHAAKMFNKRNQAQDYGEKAAEKLSKSMVRNIPKKKQGANFNKLVGGLVRHVRHSKKLKKSKGGIERQEKNQHVSKKLAKKVHWWQLLSHRPRRMRMPKKPRVKLGFGIKKSKLQAVPTIKWR